MAQGYSRQWTVALLLVGTTATAHHNSGAVFDTEREMVLEATVTRFEWRNPHVYIHADAATADQPATSWRIEAGALAIMRRLGWSADTLRSGDAIVATINPSRRTGRSTGLLVAIETQNRDLPPARGEAALEALTSDTAPALGAGSNLVGTWITLLDTDVLDVLDELPNEALTPAGRAYLESYDETTMHPGLECTPYSAPATMITPDIKRIDLLDGALRIRNEFDTAERIIYLEPPAASSRQPEVQGYSLGHWEDATLIVESSGFAPHNAGNTFTLASSPQKTLREAFTPNAARTALTYAFTLTDPIYLAQPVSAQVEWIFRPDLNFEDHPCDPENSRTFLED